MLKGTLVFFDETSAATRQRGLGRLVISHDGIRTDSVLRVLAMLLGGLIPDSIEREKVSCLVLQERGNSWDPLRETQWWVMMTDRRFSRMGLITRDGNSVHAACARFGYPVRRVEGWGKPWKRV